MSADRFPRGTRVVIPGGVLGDVVERVGTTDRGFEERLRTRWDWLAGRLGRTRRS
jgi:hypothetical protein